MNSPKVSSSLPFLLGEVILLALGASQKPKSGFPLPKVTLGENMSGLHDGNAKRLELKNKLEAKKALNADPALSQEEIKDITEKRLAEIEAEESRFAKKDATWDPTKKVFKGGASEESVKAAPVKVCKAVNMETQGSMSDAERSRLAAMVSFGRR